MMRLGDEAVSSMYRFLNEMKHELGISKKYGIFKYERPETFGDGAYIVINFLPFVHSDVINEGYVNVNIHVPQTVNKEPDNAKLSKMVKCITGRFCDSLYLDGFYFDFYCDSRPVKDNDNTFDVNLKFKVVYTDLKD